MSKRHKDFNLYLFDQFCRAHHCWTFVTENNPLCFSSHAYKEWNPSQLTVTHYWEEVAFAKFLINGVTKLLSAWYVMGSIISRK